MLESKGVRTHVSRGRKISAHHIGTIGGTHTRSIGIKNKRDVRCIKMVYGIHVLRPETITDKHSAVIRECDIVPCRSLASDGALRGAYLERGEGDYGRCLGLTLPLSPASCFPHEKMQRHPAAIAMAAQRDTFIPLMFPFIKQSFFNSVFRKTVNPTGKTLSWSPEGESPAFRAAGCGESE